MTALLRYNAVSLAGGALQVGASSLLQAHGVYHLWAYWAGIPLNTGVGFILSMVWVFRGDSAGRPSSERPESPHNRKVPVASVEIDQERAASDR